MFFNAFYAVAFIAFNLLFLCFLLGCRPSIHNCLISGFRYFGENATFWKINLNSVAAAIPIPLLPHIATYRENFYSRQNIVSNRANKKYLSGNLLRRFTALTVLYSRRIFGKFSSSRLAKHPWIARKLSHEQQAPEGCRTAPSPKHSSPSHKPHSSPPCP